ncbi:MAG: hypothetical protein U9N55_00375, partial [candidate division Zixibacteria bacterium]|nr:hypothetical protein [candidate division Zixibacteria bacterium]
MNSKVGRIIQMCYLCRMVAIVGVLMLTLGTLLVCDKEERSNPLDPINTDTLIDPPVIIGSIEGIVYENSGACAGGAMGSNVWVYWMSDETRDSVVTDEMGYFLIP